MKLGLKAGDWVEVRSCEEIDATLDKDGCLDNVPFMPEMLAFCGRTFRVSKRSDKTCDPANAPWTIRRMYDSVHLEGIRCDGTLHGGCEAGCLIFWKEAWLKKAAKGALPSNQVLVPTASLGSSTTYPIDSIHGASHRKDEAGEVVYFCQATQVRSFTHFMRWWAPGQYVRDFRSGNLSSTLAGQTRSQKALDGILAILRLAQAIIVNAAWQRRNILYPSIVGRLEKTPLVNLGLQPGELVEVRSKEEIEATLDKQNRNRGLLFDTEMVPYCGGIYRVLRRVHRIIDEKTGKMTSMKNPCIVLEGVWCKSDYHRLCPRAIYSYWRENWLKRVYPVVPQQEQETAK